MRRKLSALIAAALMVCSMPVFADVTIDSLSTSTVDSTVTVSGTTTEDSENVIITVVPKDADISTDDKFFENVAYQTPIKSVDGKYSLTFRMKGVNIFTLIASCEDGKVSKEFAYGDKDAVSAVIDQINGASSSEIAGILEENQAALGLYLDGVATAPNWAAIGASIAAMGDLSTADLNGTMLTLKRQLIFQYATDAVIDNIFAYDEYLDMFNINQNAAFVGLFTEENEVATTALLKGVKINGYEDFQNKIVEKMILAFIQSPNGASNAQNIMMVYEDLIGIKTAGVKTPVYNKIINKKYGSLTALKNRFEELTAPEDKEESSSTTTGGGGGRGQADRNNTIYAPGVSVVPPVVVGEEMFKDIANYGWAKESIEGLALKGIVSGKAAGLFYPADSVTRSEFVKMLVSALDINCELEDINFSDISASDWDYAYVRVAYSAGIINGLGDGSFGGDAQISRQDMAVILHRALTYKGIALPGRSDVAFADDAAIAGYAADAAYILREAGVMNGDDLNNFNPANSATRAEAAKVIYSIVK